MGSESDAEEMTTQTPMPSKTSTPSMPAVLPNGPVNLTQCMQWAEYYVTKACVTWHPSFVYAQLKAVQWVIYTSFSGMGCAEMAVDMISSGLRRVGDNFADLLLDVQFGTATDKNKDCQTVLHANDESRCVFTDILSWVKSGKTLHSMKFHKRSNCYTHGDKCFIDVPDDVQTSHMAARVMIAGPPCTPWSKRGNRQGNKDPQAHTHIVWAKYVLDNKFDIVIFECVYDDEVLQNITKVFGTAYSLKHARVSAYSFGYCVSRVRLYVVMVRNGTFVWTSQTSLDDMLKPFHRRTCMPLRDTFFLGRTEIPDVLGTWDPDKGVVENLSKSEQLHLGRYFEDFPNKLLWDLSQNSAWGPNHELKNGALPNLTTNCGSLYSTELRRTMQPTELLLNQGVPVTAKAACAAGVRPVLFPVSRSAAVRMAGNGMHVPSVGAVVLAAMLHIKRVPDV